VPLIGSSLVTGLHYLDAKPDHLVVRGQYAELLWRLDRLDDARIQFERFDAELQDHEKLASQHLVQCHSRLMDIAFVRSV
jgi:hypothetical protein